MMRDEGDKAHQRVHGYSSDTGQVGLSKPPRETGRAGTSGAKS